MSGAGRRAFSWGPPFAFRGDVPSSLRCLWLSFTVLACSTSGSGGLSEQRALGCFRFHASLVVLRVLPGVGAGSEARGEGLRCSQAAVVLAYEVQVTASLLVCLATLLSQYRRCCCLS